MIGRNATRPANRARSNRRRAWTSSSARAWATCIISPVRARSCGSVSKVSGNGATVKAAG